MTILDDLEHRSLLILGLAREGMSVYSFLRRRYPQKKLALADQRADTAFEAAIRQQVAADSHVELILGADSMASIPRFEVIFKSPGISPFLPEISDAVRRGQRISSNTELFFDVCPGTTIGVTGTKGKSTTTALIYETLRAGGIDVRLAGNIGVPPLESLEDVAPSTVFVLELSSHQLYGLRRSPTIAVLQDIVPEHLDYYGSFEAYLRAKQTIAEHQTEHDYLVFNAASTTAREIAGRSRAQAVAFGFEQAGSTCCYLDRDAIAFRRDGQSEPIVPVDAVPLIGAFNLLNVMPAVVIGKLFNIPNGTIAAAIRDFKALEHRLEFAGSVHGVRFYNDSLSTVPEAAIAAIQSFDGRPIILLAGGFDREQDYAELARAILAGQVKGLLLFPTTGQRLWEELTRQGTGSGTLPEHRFVNDMEQAVRTAYEWAEEGDVVLLSPAAASFGSFNDYRDRGNRFKAEAAKLIDELHQRDHE